MFFRGRARATAHVGVWTAATGAGLLFWNGGIEVPGSPNAANVSARLTIPLLAALASACLATPRMPSWERTAIPRVGRLAAGVCLAGIVSAVASLTICVLFVAWAPDGAIPGYFVGAEDLLLVLRPLIWNTVLLSSIAFVFVACVGRGLGIIATIVAYILLVLLGANVTVFHLVPYYSQAFGIPVSEHPVAATSAATVAIFVWWRTGGASALARRLDPRH